MTTPAHRHGPQELCATGLELYGRALREGSVPEHEAAEAPCVIRSGLLQPDLDDVHRLRPVAPALALPRLLRGIAEDIALRRRAETRPAEAFEPLPALGTGPAPDAGTGLITLLSGVERISDAIRHAMLRSCDEVLTIQPGGKRPVPVLAAALPMEQELLSRGGRMRTLYRHTTRYDPAVLAHYECLDGDVEVRTLDQCPGRQRLPDGANVACWGTSAASSYVRPVVMCRPVAAPGSTSQPE
ncbi:hypothetical protein ACWD4N_02500 [Streptomyces sp. NPDC002586]